MKKKLLDFKMIREVNLSSLVIEMGETRPQKKKLLLIKLCIFHIFLILEKENFKMNEKRVNQAHY